MADNFNRMIGLVTSFFDVKNDPDQLSVNEDVIERLHRIHPATLSEFIDGDGPVVWILVIPTTTDIMNRFINGAISEGRLYNETIPGAQYDAIYLCSATVLPEFRNKGMARQMTIDAIKSIAKDHTIKVLFYWPFSEEGKALARSVAKAVALPLYEKVET